MCAGLLYKVRSFLARVIHPAPPPPPCSVFQVQGQHPQRKYLLHPKLPRVLESDGHPAAGDQLQANRGKPQVRAEKKKHRTCVSRAFALLKHRVRRGSTYRVAVTFHRHSTSFVKLPLALSGKTRLRTAYDGTVKYGGTVMCCIYK